MKIVLDSSVKNGLKWWVVIDGKEWYLLRKGTAHHGGGAKEDVPSVLLKTVVTHVRNAILVPTLFSHYAVD